MAGEGLRESGGDKARLRVWACGRFCGDVEWTAVEILIGWQCEMGFMWDWSFDMQ